MRTHNQPRLTKNLIWLAFFLVGLLIVLAGTYSLYSTQDNQTVDLRDKGEVTITLSKTGFDPREVYISPSTTVTFLNGTDKHFWPASDLHPFHEILSDFDSKKPIDGGDSWSYTFLDAGRWDYHDHVGLETGSIIVVPRGEYDLSRYHSMITCNQTDRKLQASCEKRHIALVLESEGVDAAFSVLANLYDTNAFFRESCHLFAHDLGLMTSQLYGENFTPTLKTTYCGQGFYHGYMEGHLQANNGDFVDSIRFCESQAAALGGDTTIAGPQCIHGMGHGVMEYLLRHHQELLSDMERLVEKGLNECDLLSSFDEKFRCASGVYAVTKDWINMQDLTHEYENLFTLEDPVKLCRSLTIDWQKEACAWEMGKQVINLASRDYDLAFTSIINGSSDWDDALYTPFTITSTAFYIGEDNVNLSSEELASKCGILDDTKYYLDCIKGLTQGILFNSPPEREGERVAQFCTSSALTTEAQLQCTDTAVDAIRSIYGERKLSGACDYFREIPDSDIFCS